MHPPRPSLVAGACGAWAIACTSSPPTSTRTLARLFAIHRAWAAPRRLSTPSSTQIIPKRDNNATPVLLSAFQPACWLLHLRTYVIRTGPLGPALVAAAPDILPMRPTSMLPHTATAQRWGQHRHLTRTEASRNRLKFSSTWRTGARSCRPSVISQRCPMLRNETNS